MKVLMVLTSHDQLGNTGRKNPRIAQGRAPAARSHGSAIETKHTMCVADQRQSPERSPGD